MRVGILGLEHEGGYHIGLEHEGGYHIGLEHEGGYLRAGA